MKNKIFLLTILSLVLIFSGCGKKDETTNLPVNASGNNAATTNNGENATDKTAEGEDATNTANADDEKKDEVEEIPTENLKTKEVVQALMRKSDYISKVKMTKQGDAAPELKIMDNFKGNLSSIEFASPEDLELNREYLIFYKDDENGDIVPTNGKQSYIQVADSNDAILEYVEGVYKPKEEVKETTDTNKSSTTTTKPSTTTTTKPSTSTTKSTDSKSDTTNTNDKKDTDSKN